MGERSAVSRRTYHTEQGSKRKEIILNTPQIEASSNEKRKTGLSLTTDEKFRNSHRENSSRLLSPSSRMNVKGKQRASTDDNLDGRIAGDHDHGNIHQDESDAEQSAVKPEITRSPHSASVPTELGEHSSLGQMDDFDTDTRRNSDRSIPKQLRTRDPLSIAQAHLSGSGTQPKAKKHCPAPSREDIQSNPRVDSQRDTEQPSSLSKLSDTTQPKAEHDRITKQHEDNPDDSYRRGEFQVILFELVSKRRSNLVKEIFTGPVSGNLRGESTRRLEADRPAQAVQEIGPDDTDNTSHSPKSPDLSLNHASSCLTSNTGDASGSVQAFDSMDLAAKSRARARLNMKLVIEKHLHTSRTHQTQPEQSLLDNKSRVSDKREGMLRAVLENRRRGG